MRYRSDPDFMQGGGDAGARLRATDWEGSPLGPPEHWPDNLKVAIGLLLPSSTQICLFWGADLVTFHNDAFGRLSGGRHPAALGQPGWESSGPDWRTLEPLLRGILLTGEPFDSRNHPFRQNHSGFAGDTHLDLSCSPLRGGDGAIDGVFCIVSDQTGQHISDRRFNSLRMLSLRSLIDTPDGVARSFVSVLAEHDHVDAPCALVYLRAPDGSLALAAAHGGTPDPSLLAVPGTPCPTADPRRAALFRVADTGAIESLADSRFMIDPTGAASNQLVLLPLHAGSDVIGVLAVAKNRQLPSTPDYHRFLELLAAQLSASLSAARMLAEERRRASVLEQQVAAALAEREATEAQLRQSQKMEAIGKLTGGVAHDFNNLLQVVGGNLQLLSRDVAGNARAERRIANALAGVTRGAKLSAQVLAFSRRQPLEPTVVRIGPLVVGLDDMLRHLLGEAIEIETVIDAQLWNTLIDAAQLENALLNLAINARDAMDGQGRLTIEVGNATLDDEQDRPGDGATPPGYVPAQYVMVTVTDNGSGMTPEVLEQVFEPFFSTKPAGKGTGLGLSMVYGFVKRSGGRIGIDSEPGRGSTIRLYLPRSLLPEGMRENDMEADIPAEDEAGPAPGGTETILVAEDNDAVRDTVSSMLIELGYQVLRARDAASALNVIESGVSIDLLLTDVVMPGAMRGPDLADKARERIPGIAVLFTSGYTECAIAEDGRADAGIDLLPKPYTSGALARKLRTVLASGNAGPVPVADAGSPAAIPATAASIRPLRLLLVEDDPMIRDNTAELLASHGHAVMQAGSGEAAIDMLARESFDVLVTDLGLPGIGGVDLARLALERSRRLGLVFATGKDGIGEEMSGPLGRAVLLRKPYDEPALIASVDGAMRNLRT